MINGFSKVPLINITLPCEVHSVYLPFARDRAEDFRLLSLTPLAARRDVYWSENTSLLLDNFHTRVSVCMYDSDKKISSVMKSE